MGRRNADFTNVAQKRYTQKDTVVYLIFSLGGRQIYHHPLLMHSVIKIQNSFKHLYICIGMYNVGTEYAHVYMHMAVQYLKPLIGESRGNRLRAS